MLMVAFLLQLQRLTEVEIKRRTQTYLCFKRQVFKQFKLIRRMVRLNRAIVAGRALMLVPKTFVAGKKMAKVAQTAQALLNKRYFLPAQGCPWRNAKSPFGFKIKRNALGLAKYKERQWKMIVRQRRSLYPFQLEAHFRSPQYLASLPRVHYREKKLARNGVAFWLRRWSGVESFSPSSSW